MQLIHSKHFIGYLLTNIIPILACTFCGPISSGTTKACSIIHAFLYMLPEHFTGYLLESYFYLLAFCCCSLSTLRFDALCVQRCSSAYHCCNVWLFALLSPSWQLWPVWLLCSSGSNILRKSKLHLLFVLVGSIAPGKISRAQKSISIQSGLVSDRGPL